MDGQNPHLPLSHLLLELCPDFYPVTRESTQFATAATENGCILQQRLGIRWMGNVLLNAIHHNQDNGRSPPFRVKLFSTQRKS
ncbi:hypothetical protein OUZ56_008380 [Daphnia magna]|uniref:Uncharacterized protein n=1 Tax=Daphnia magna TaxID=35525 RepID=A0ABR0ACU6_9CRUS|nr:hypothetical protein OUZ56_008380 [Daphnia magna]